jgi:hypothetical protein
MRLNIDPDYIPFLIPLVIPARRKFMLKPYTQLENLV